MKKYILLPFIGLIFWMNGTAQCKPEHFPKKIEYPKQIPNHEHFWIFIMAGQSNMAGRGTVEPQDTLPNPRILTVDLNNDWVVAKEPLHNYQPKLTGLDCGISFARELIKSVGDSITIGLVPCAVGGSPIESWMSDSVFNGVQLFSNFKEKTGMAMKYGKIKGILWHQGESDAFPEKIPVYKQKLKAVMTEMRKFIGIDSLPIIMGELGSYTRPENRQENWNAVNVIIRSVSQDLSNCYVVPTNDLTPKPDYIHFDSQSQRILGKRYAEKFISINLINQKRK
ncbi:sialate O-acetylesterase [Labilibaculum euxinus]|uniref:Sialate O-acetylesterase n=1 Tax=Labilibaculum euxinus TaxID=2686357 RepID=A0A7M4D962_9BACT|nr:sialate O-acetylesterase [Labilibaculum euxinus]MUP39191.1 sialate O-acetylesterase [Labilibaculum euxinus]MVB08396.1 sialate O-acetylesterase [Labilibaculum euxinus]